MYLLRPICKVGLLAVIPLILSCGDGDGGTVSDTGSLTVSVSDSPIHEYDISAVCIAFSRITVRYADGGPEIAIPIKPTPPEVSTDTHCLDMPVWDGVSPAPPVKLDALGGSLKVALADSIPLPAGRIISTKFHIIPGKSYVEDSMGVLHTLTCPICEPTGNNQEQAFFINMRSILLEVLIGHNTSVLVDVDLRKSLYQEDGSDNFVLQPIARMEHSERLAIVTGVVNETLITNLGGKTYTGSDIDTGCAVYAYGGYYFSNYITDDYYDGSPVINTTSVKYDTAHGDYRYVMATLKGGGCSDRCPDPYERYVISLTCDADDPLTDETLQFTPAKDASVLAGDTKIVDF